jgi:hypothetical protein
MCCQICVYWNMGAMLARELQWEVGTMQEKWWGVIMCHLPLYKIIHVCLKLFKLCFWDIRPEALEALGPDFLKRSINSTFLRLLAPWSTSSACTPIKVYTMPNSEKFFAHYYSFQGANLSAGHQWLEFTCNLINFTLTLKDSLGIKF